MATYGDFPGVKITTTGGGLTGVAVGAEEVLVLFGPGSSSANASVNDPTQITTLASADRKFGDGSPLSEAVKQALSNGANREYLYGVLTERISTTGENIGNGSTATNHTEGAKIQNRPIHEDDSVIMVYDGTGTLVFDGSAGDVGFVYETNTDDTSTDFSSTTAASGEFEINPHTGEWRDDGTGADYSIDYDHDDYGTALDSADTVLNEGDTGIYGAITESPDVHSSLSAKMTTLRDNFQMAQAIAGARPNATNADGEATFTTSNYSDNTDDDSVYLVAPTRENGYSGHPSTVVGAVSGLMAGHPVTDPIYNDAVTGLDGLTQKLTGTESDDLRNEKAIPLRDGASIRVKSNSSTSTSTDWTRDFWRRRIVDRVLLLTKQVGDDTVGRINDDDTRQEAENVLDSEISELVDDRLVKPNLDGETRWYVEVVEDDTNADQINIDVGVTPQGIVKRIDETVTING